VGGLSHGLRRTLFRRDLIRLVHSVPPAFTVSLPPQRTEDLTLCHMDTFSGRFFSARWKVTLERHHLPLFYHYLSHSSLTIPVCLAIHRAEGSPLFRTTLRKEVRVPFLTNLPAFISDSFWWSTANCYSFSRALPTF